METICVFGDSIAWGSDDNEEGGWVNRLSRLLGEPIYNLGIPGDKVNDLLRRFDDEVEARQPSTVVLAIGINDAPHSIYDGTPIELFRTIYGELLSRALSRTRNVVLITPTNVDESHADHGYRNADIELIVGEVRSLALDMGLKCINVFGSMTADDLKADGLHPGPNGHAKLAAAVMAALS